MCVPNRHVRSPVNRAAYGATLMMQQLSATDVVKHCPPYHVSRIVLLGFGIEKRGEESDCVGPSSGITPVRSVPHREF